LRSFIRIKNKPFIIYFSSKKTFQIRFIVLLSNREYLPAGDLACSMGASFEIAFPEIHEFLLLKKTNAPS